MPGVIYSQVFIVSEITFMQDSPLVQSYYFSNKYNMYFVTTFINHERASVSQLKLLKPVNIPTNMN